MINTEQYDYARKMLEILDMNLDDFLFDKYLNIALGYETQNGFFCGNYKLENAIISVHQSTLSQRAARPILAIVTFG
ncbi:hypothetical protein [Acinetobacter variabilis]|uniref:hypothetical protein n=1 Tax=Acinetobacter variabilis TaxID=70346 RepID=UPI0028ADC3D1|nr:hypothetical protein [Acinetobacter variabilis]